MIRKTIQYNPTGDTYLFNLQIISTNKDFGFFDVYEPYTGTSNNTPINFIVTGYSNSRLLELRKYVVTGSLSEIYTTSNNVTDDGLDLSKTTTGLTDSTYVYYIGEITYTDTVTQNDTKTHFMFESNGFTDMDLLDNYPTIKTEEKQNVVENPTISKDVKIIRQEIPVFEQTIRLRAINTLNDILVYGGGKFFTIHNNT